MTQGMENRRGLVSLNPSARPPARLPFPRSVVCLCAVGANSTSPSSETMRIDWVLVGLHLIPGGADDAAVVNGGGRETEAG